MKEEFERSKKESLRVAAEEQDMMTRIERKRATPLARAGERDQTVSMAKDVASFAVEATKEGRSTPKVFVNTGGSGTTLAIPRKVGRTLYRRGGCREGAIRT